MCVGDGFHAVPRTGVWRNFCTSEVGKLLVGKVQILHFVQNDKTQFLFPIPCFLSRCGNNVRGYL